MYQVYSMIRSGHPLWTTVATGLLLAVSTAMAAYVAHHKRTGGTIVLGESKSYRELGLRAKLPADWEIGTPEPSNQGHMLVATPAGDEPNSELVLFRSGPMLLGMMPIPREEAVRQAVQAMIPAGRIVHSEQVGISTIGPLKSEVFRILILSRRSTRLWALANVATSPSRHTYGAVILVDDKLSIRDQKLLDEVSKNISLEDVKSQPTRPTNPSESINDSRKPMVTRDWEFIPA